MKNISKKILSGILAAGMALSLIPSFGTTAAYAAQSNEYTDPADVWIKANGRTNELDINATTTYETNYCPVCKMQTTFLAYRVPEYTRTGETALNRGVEWSDGTMIDGVNTGNLDSGTPGIDASYTGYHFTKTVCQNCGTINSSNGEGSYSFGKNVYGLNPCDHNFFLPFDNTTYEQHDDHYHIKIEKEGEYCQYCKGTYATAKEKQEHHHLDDTIIAELGNQRFHIIGDCDDCGYIENDYVAAKAVVQSYYGKVDGDAHSITLTDLSESGVNTSIRYGIEADKCNKTSAPSYTDEGYYPVYYEITYSYDGESMTEDGVSYVWLLSAENSTTTVSSVHTHDFRYLETVKPTCTELGYERWQCSECGALEKRNYTPATGHDYDTVTIREASCTQGGLVLHLCKDCGDFYTETTPTTDHDYEKHIVPATCIKAGYTEYKCKDCGHSYITEITALIPHNYIASVTEPTCTTKGFTTYTCDICGDTYISDYTEPTDHEWDEGHTITVATCDGEGVIEYNCLNCDEKMIKAISAKGHTAGAPATCTEPQICLDCGAILELPTGHHYHTTVFEPTCTSMGYTVYECDEGDHSYIADYTDKLPHNYKASVTAPTCTEMGYTTYVCDDCGDSYISDYTDKLPHNYKASVTAPTCTEMGFTTYTCEDCGDTYISDYTDALGHKPSDWIIDIPATIEHEGSKHIECERTGEILMTKTIPQLIAQDNSDEDGNSKVGDYDILITDTNGKPVFNSEISIDLADNITIKLPADRLLSADDITTITVTKNQQPVKGLFIFVADTNGNGATGNTDDNGQLSVPNAKSSTGDTNGTVTDDKNTYVVIATDKNGVLIPDCEVIAGDNYSIDVKLPDGTAFDKDNRVTITVVNENGEPIKGLRVQVIGDGDYIENGNTNVKGQVTLPMTNTDITDDKGNAEVGEVKDDKIYDYKAYGLYKKQGREELPQRH